jgi:predicted ATPase with chaperone activity
MLVKTFGSAVFGINAATITIEADVAKGIKFLLVGLPDIAVKKNQQRRPVSLGFVGVKKKVLFTVMKWRSQFATSNLQLPDLQ